MKKLLKNKIVQIGLMAFTVIAASILFYFCLFRIDYFFNFLGLIVKILMPLIVGLVMAYIMTPIVKLFERKIFNKLEKPTIKRNLSIFCTLVVIIGVLTALISVIIPQLLLSIQSLIVNVPSYLTNIEKAIMSWLSDNPDLEETILANYDIVSDYLTSGLNNVVLPMVDKAITGLSNSIFVVFNFIFNLAIGTVFAVYILANTSRFSAQIRKLWYALFDVSKVNWFINEIRHIHRVFGHFMVGKICDSSIVAFITFLFLFIFRISPYPLLIAVIIGLTDLIPYFGPYIGTVPSALLIFLESPVKAITFVIFMIVLQQLDGNLITPKIQKQATGLPSFWVLFAITLFGGLFGLVGLLIGVPCFTIIYELVVDFIQDRLKEKELPLSTDYYQNLQDGVIPLKKSNKG